MTYDAIVIGAGAAGLAALDALDDAGMHVLCLEARERVGGRVLTLHDPDTPVPIELGAEFVHGRPAEIDDVAQRAGLHLVETGGHMIRVRGGRVTEGGDDSALLDDLERSASPEHDETFQNFLDRSSYKEEEKQAAAGFVEGFNAARKEEVSTAALAIEMKAADAIDGDEAFHIREGYAALIAAMTRGHSEVRVNAPVESIVWSSGHCSVHTRSGDCIEAARVVITVPLGVLQAGGLLFDPEPREALAAAHVLRFGLAVRVTFRFENAFWEDLPDFRDAGFILSDEPVFPVWWSTLPVRAPVLTAWSAGPKADALRGLSTRDVEVRAIESLRRIMGVEPARVEQAWTHDWYADPFSRGAYSYVPAGGLWAREVLARPVEHTLYFAGEAIDLLGYGGTVHGAIASGRRAARQILGKE